MNLVIRAVVAWLLFAVAASGAAAQASADAQLASAQGQIAAVSGAGRVALAGHADAHGNWTFANVKDERFSAATPDEMKRVVPVLAAGAEAARPSIYMLTPDTVFGELAAWKMLPVNAELHMALGTTAYRLIRTMAGGLQVEVRPALAVAARNRAGFEAALWYFARPFERTRMRLIALEVGGPQVFSSMPRLDAKSRDALIDVIEPSALVGALAGLRGQTAVLTGRIEGEALVGLDTKGRSPRVAFAPLFDAAMAADVGVVVLQVTNPAQMGGRNWLYQKIEARGLSDAAGRGTFGDFFEALAAEERFVAVANVGMDGRLELGVTRSGLGASGEIGSRVGRVLKDLASTAMGKVPVVSIRAALPAEARQRELDRRWVSWLPASWSWVYAGLFLLGLIGWPVASRWFARAWPEERPSEYRNAFGFEAARAIRAALIAGVFAPLVAVASAPLRIYEMIMRRSRAD